MAWRHTLLPASYKGIPFDVLDDDLNLTHSLSEHGYPYVAGDDVADLGIRARRIRLHILIWGDGYERRLQTLLAALAETGPGELVHPIYGSIPDCVVDTVDTSHAADGVDQCDVTVDFVQSTAAAPFFGRVLPLSLADRIDALADRALATAGRLVESILGAGDTSAAQALIARLFSGVSDLTGRAYAGSVAIASQPGALLGAMRSLLGDISAGALADTDTPGTGGWHEMIDTQERLVALPHQLARDDRRNKRRSTARGGVPAAIPAALTGLAATAAAAETASQAADLIAADLDAASPSLTPEDIDLLVGSGRTRIARALAACRCLAAMAEDGDHSATAAATLDAVCRGEMDPDAAFAAGGSPVASHADLDAWRDIAYALQQQGRALLELRPPLVTRTVPRDMPLVLLAYEWYGDHGRRIELLRLNPSIRHPNFLARGEVLRAYAA